MDVLNTISLITSFCEPMLVPVKTCPSSKIRKAFIIPPFSFLFRSVLSLYEICISYFNLSDSITTRETFQLFLSNYGNFFSGILLKCVLGIKCPVGIIFFSGKIKIP